jgi:uncharacterized SAM-binding protein YcdF (DUF218 family)
MSTLFIFILVAFTLALGCTKYKKLCTTFALLTLICFLLIGDGFIPSYLLQFLQTNKLSNAINWQKNNTIIVLGAGTSKPPGTEIKPSLMAFSRITAAAELYRRCKTKAPYCYILISGGDPLHNGKSEAATYRDTLLALGIPQTDIQLETLSKNTFQNAKFTSNLLKKHQNEQILLLSSGLTLKRALLYFSYFNIYPTPIPSDFITIPFSIFPLGYNLAMNDFAIHEIIGIVRFYIYNFFDWNKKPLKPRI